MSSANFLVTDAIFDDWLTRFFSNTPVKIPSNYKVPFGTHEWCDESYNTHWGCRNGCKYCYAWTNAWNKRNLWVVPAHEYYGRKIVLKKNWYKTWRNRPAPYIIMYPSAHDVFPETMCTAFRIMKTMLRAKNISVLFVTKPRIRVIEAFIKEFRYYRKRITTRLTITTNNNEHIAIWEPYAPRFQERLLCLKRLYKENYKTSVSMEPLLPPKLNTNKTLIAAVIALVYRLLAFVTDKLWIGTMNHIPTTKLRGNLLTPLWKNRFNMLRDFYSNELILALTKEFYQISKIFWKESIKKQMIQIMQEEVLP